MNMLKPLNEQELQLNESYFVFRVSTDLQGNSLQVEDCLGLQELKLQVEYGPENHEFKFLSEFGNEKFIQADPFQDNERTVFFTAAEPDYMDILDLFEAAGFEGIDASLEISLFEYGFIYNPRTEALLQARPDIDPEELDIFESSLFDRGFIGAEEIREEISEAGPGFFSCIGMDKELYMSMGLNSSQAISDLNGYYGTFRPTHYRDSLTDCLTMLCARSVNEYSNTRIK